MLLYGNPKGYKLVYYVTTKVEVNPWMLSTLKNAKIHLKHEPRGGVEATMVAFLGILFGLVNRKIGHVYSNSGKFSGRHFMSPFLVIIFILVI